MNEPKTALVVLAHEVERLRNLNNQLEDENETLKSLNNELVRTLTKVATQAKPVIFTAENKDDVTK